MKIQIAPYNPNWKNLFSEIREELTALLSTVRPQIEHIGSTSVEGLPAKPVIDILVGLDSESLLDQTVAPLISGGYVYYEKYNEDMPYRRFFIKFGIPVTGLSLPLVIRKNDSTPAEYNAHDHRIAHIHVMPNDSEHWLRHIAFRDYLRSHADVKAAYGQLKENLSRMEWRDGNHYNEGKEEFLKQEEQLAVAWYRRRQ